MRAWRPGVCDCALVVGVAAAGDVEAAETAAVGGGGRRAGSARPGGPRAGIIVCGARAGCIVDAWGLTATCCCFLSVSKPSFVWACDWASSSGALRNVLLRPSTKANLPSFLSLSRSSPPLFLASCLQKSYSLIQDTSTTAVPSSPPSWGVLSASQRKRTMSQFAVAPRVLVSKRMESSRGRRT